MGQDITLPIEDGYVNVRVGAIIEKDGKILMVGNDTADYCYSVGGRIQFGESAEDAVRREVLEETGWELEIDRLGFIQEDFFLGDSPAKRGKLIYEIGFYFYMKTPGDFAPRCESLTEEGRGEHLEWISPDTEKTIYPAFFRTMASDPVPYVRHVVTDERN
jgi:8-oxo-dGTP pyrophosphatase MutT (NUDIX family)